MRGQGSLIVEVGGVGGMVLRPYMYIKFNKYLG